MRGHLIYCFSFLSTRGKKRRFGCFIVSIGLAALGSLQPRGDGFFAGWQITEQAAILAGANHMYSNFIRLALTGTVFCSIATTLANAQTASSTDSDIRSAYIESYGQSPDTGVLQVLANLFQQFDRTGNGIDAADIDYFEKQQAAQIHANIASQWLRLDVNADLKVTREEVEGSLSRYRSRAGAMTEQQTKRINEDLKKQIDMMFLADANADGVVEGIELYTPQQRRDNEYVYLKKGTAFVKALLRADPDGDGKVTQTEAALIASHSLDGVDVQITQNLAQRQVAQMGDMSEQCPKIEVAKESSVILLGTYEGTSLSSVTVAGQDETTHAATLFIEDGSTPLTLVLTSYSPMVWNVTGAKQRIVKMILGGPMSMRSRENAATGVVGIDRNKVQFIKNVGCLNYFHVAKSEQGLMTSALFQKMSGKAPDIVFGKYAAGIVAIPSGRGTSAEVTEVERVDLKTKAAAQFYTIGQDGKLLAFDATKEQRSLQGAERLLFNFNPDGVMSFKVSDVVSGSKAEDYNVYPEHAGLLQLLGQGRIEAFSGGHGGWKIKSAIRFPAGLAGALMTSFFVPKGVKIPEGNPGHSKVFSEETASYIDFN